MATGPHHSALGHLRQLLDQRQSAELTDRQLLERFTSRQEEAAFAALVRRHGPLVLGVCRRLLHHEHDAEDAFQATFLVLARKAQAVRKQESVSSWLYGVAYRIALRARARAAQRRVCERQVQPMPQADPSTEAAARELRAVLEEELQRLPEKYRSPLVLCYLEGQSNSEAARSLGWPVGTVKGRLTRARDLLRARLTRRGLALSAGAVATLLGEGAASAIVPAPLVSAIVRCAVGFAAGASAAGMSASVVELAQGVLQAMILTKMKVLVIGVLAVSIFGIGAGVLYNAQLSARSSQLILTGATPLAQQPLPAEQVQPPRREHADRYGDPLPANALARLGTLRLRHGDLVRAVAFAPDGKTVIAADWHGIRVWDMATGKELRRFGAQPLRSCIALSQSGDGQTLASADSGGTIFIWDWTTGRSLRSFGQKQVRSISLSPDGRILASLGHEGPIHLWDVATGRELRQLLGHQGDVHTLAFLPGGKTLISGGADKTIRLWDVATGQELRQIHGHPNEVGTIAVAPDGKTLATIGSNRVEQTHNVSPFSKVITWFRDNRVRLWDMATGKELRQLGAPAKEMPPPKGYYPDGISIAAFTPDSQTLVTGGIDAVLRFWDVATGKEVRRLPGHANTVMSLAFSPDGRTLASGGGDKMVRLWDLAMGKELLPTGGHEGSVYGLALTSDGRTIATASWDKTIRLWETATGKELRRLVGHKGGNFAVCLSADGRIVASAGDDQTIRIWEMATGQELRQLQGHEETIRSLAFSPDGRLLTSGGADKTICVWEMATGRRLHQLKGQKAWVATVAFSPDSRTLFAWSGDKVVHIWDVATGQEVRQFAAGGERAYCCAFSPDGKLAAFGEQERVIRVYDLATGQEVRRFTGLSDATSCVAFSADGRTVASGGWQDPTIRLWEVATGQERCRFAGHQGRVVALAFSLDGRVVASGNDDTTVLVWDATSGTTAGRPSSRKLSSQELEGLWKELADADVARAYRAIWTLGDAPGPSVRFLNERLRPVVQPTAEQLARWVKDLDREQLEVREQATAELERLGELAEPALRQALAGQPPLEMRRRVEQLLDKLKPFQSRERLRTGRALEALETMGTPEAKQLFETLAHGAPAAWLTREAQASLERLAQRPHTPP